MRVVVACDSFKGSLTSAQANVAVGAGIRAVRPDVEIVTFEVADGGEGTAAVITEALGGSMVTCRVTDPLGRIIIAEYGIADDLAIIDVASACGLTLLADNERNPLIATTRGVGELLNDAYRRGCHRYIIGLGGTATCDGGVGMIENLNDDVRKCRVIVMCDVNNPLCGPQGAARVFAPQKGATPEQVEILEARMQQLANHQFKHVANNPGAGAAGGLGAAFMAMFNAEVHSGVDTVLDIIGFEKALEGADLVITGEGSIDAQSLMGKLPVGILRRAQMHGVPVIAIAGVVKNREALINAGFTDVIAIKPADQPLAEAMHPATAAANITTAVNKIFWTGKQ